MLMNYWKHENNDNVETNFTGIIKKINFMVMSFKNSLLKVFDI